jgi:hypothetical protein
MNGCPSCRYSAGQYRGASCPIFAITPDRFCAGCSQWTPRMPQDGAEQPAIATVGPVTSRHAMGREEPVMHPAKPAKLERDLQRLCEQELSRRGIWFLHLSPMAREAKGCPDLLFALRGQACAVELKTSDGVVSQDQLKAHAHMTIDGWTVIVCRSFVEFRSFLDGISL